MTRIAVLITCFNRRALTLACLGALFASRDLDGVTLDVFLVDDGSRDGTAAAVTAGFPQVHVIAGSGKLFWNGGTRLAWQHALKTQPDFYLWLNDDLSIAPDALSRALTLWRMRAPGVARKLVIVGRTVDPQSGAMTYGGYIHASGLSRLRFTRPVQPEAVCDTFNGNFVLFPATVPDDIGINSADYIHAYGDNDYGLRARRAGYVNLQMAGPVGAQARNKAYEESTARLTIGNWRYILFDPKGVSLREWWIFCRTHGGWIWPVNFFGRYIKLALARG